MFAIVYGLASSNFRNAALAYAMRPGAVLNADRTSGVDREPQQATQNAPALRPSRLNVADRATVGTRLMQTAGAQHLLAHQKALQQGLGSVPELVPDEHSVKRFLHLMFSMQERNALLYPWLFRMMPDYTFDIGAYQTAANAVELMIRNYVADPQSDLANLTGFERRASTLYAKVFQAYLGNATQRLTRGWGVADPDES